jgi:glutamate racemase
MKKVLSLTFLLISHFLVAQTSITETIKNDKKSFYYIDFKQYPARNTGLPIGVFDSGTGGLTVFNAIVNFDNFNNQTGEAGKDGQPDFSKEDFIYLADQANMPYGNYSAVDKVALLNEHIIKDTQFMLGRKYYAGQNACRINKKPVKVLVIACNTATAYGKENIEKFIAETGIDMKVIGVIDAGVKGALQTFKPDENGSIGVFATAGTVASKGYTNTLTKLRKELNYTGDIQYYSVGGVGLAEAVDEQSDYLDRKQTAPRTDYRGPSLANDKLLIDRTLMEIYNFDFAEYKMLCDAKKVDDCSQLQINSADNYVRYHLVSLLENMRKTPNAMPLKTLILGCTHYPYMTDAINKVLKELYTYQKDGVFRYKHLLTQNVNLIDPSINTAQELYDFMQKERLFNAKGSMQNSEFYISVPNVLNKNVQLDANKNFTYDYKYGRNEGQNEEFIINTPFSESNISKEVYERLKLQIPAVYGLISTFWKENKKVAYLRKR